MRKKFALNATPELKFSRNERKSPTELKQLHVHELVEHLLERNPSFKGARGIAVDMGVHIATVYRLAANPKDDGIELLPKRFFDFVKSTKTLSIWLKYIKTRCED